MPVAACLPEDYNRSQHTLLDCRSGSVRVRTSQSGLPTEQGLVTRPVLVLLDFTDPDIHARASFADRPPDARRPGLLYKLLNSPASVGKNLRVCLLPTRRRARGTCEVGR